MRSRSAWASCSRRAGAVAAALACVALAAPAAAKVFHSQKEGLALAFPEADRIDEETWILGAAQKQAIEKLARAPLESEIVTLYSGWKGETLLGWAYIDVHTVRTLPEAFLVVLDPQGAVRSLRVLAFHEPLDYLPTERWYRQFDGRSIVEPLRLGGDVHGIVGATLSARAVTRSVRRVLAFHEVLIGDGPVQVSGSPAAPAVSSGGAVR
jgi:hypothetical protein